ncbi:MAG: ABC transporter ATP-binding protein [Armatimonadetes bacterium]|nr:ABC transporter ATP-binding protein [Armatimonadota bacterium]
MECVGLGKSYGEQTALNDLNLSIQPGDAFGFIGPNGAGKTTTIRILATLAEPSAGDARVGGYSVREEPDEVRRLLGYMPDSFGVYDGMRVWEYLDFYAAAYRVPRVKRAALIDDVLALTDLTVKKDAFVEGLSTGMKQRLCLSKTLLHDPQVLLLDEPASGLDPRARIELKELLRELTRMGKTLFVSSHILPELSDFCNKVGILEAGRLLACGEVEQILSQLSSRRHLAVKVLRQMESARKLIESFPGAGEVREYRGALRFEFDGELEDMALLSERLVADGHGLVGFHEEKSDLEQIFLKVTKGTVA